LRFGLALAFVLYGLPAAAADIALVGLMTDKAMVIIDGGKRQTLSVGGAAVSGVKLVAVESGVAEFEIDGKRRRMQIGQSVVSVAKTEKPRVVLAADQRGHFVTPGSINGAPMRFLVDTGASLIALGASDARRARIDPAKGTPAMVMTANGAVRVSRVRLDKVKVGDIVLNDIEASVHSQDMPIVLLGMSFLNRMEMHRDAASLTLTQRY
jgi:aspartyl protease family protein